jgi:Uncharacterised MFS-type transporter YbfB
MGARDVSPLMAALPRVQAHQTSLWVVAGLAMAPAVALGLARFAYALLLPAMRADLGWSYANAGAMNTARPRVICLAPSRWRQSLRTGVLSGRLRSACSRPLSWLELPV